MTKYGYESMNMWNQYAESVQADKDGKQLTNKESGTWKISHSNTEYWKPQMLQPGWTEQICTPSVTTHM